MTIKKQQRHRKKQPQQKWQQRRQQKQKRQQQLRKLSFSTFTFFTLKLIIFMLLPFISIKGDDFLATRSLSQMEALNGMIGRDGGGNGGNSITNNRQNGKMNFYIQGGTVGVGVDVDGDGDGDGTVTRNTNDSEHSSNKSGSPHIDALLAAQRNFSLPQQATYKIDSNGGGGNFNVLKSDLFGNTNSKFNENGERILSRNRRYLIFPEGSSLQLVADTYHPIVDKANLLILGITAAMAWELPSQPYYIDEELHNSYEMGNLPLLKQRKDKNSTALKYTQKTVKLQPSHAPITYSNRKNEPVYYTQETLPIAAGGGYHPRIPINTYYYGNGGTHANLLRPSSGYSHPWTPTHDRGAWPPISNKMDYYLSYADKLFKNFNGLTGKTPKNPNWSQFANVITDTLKNRKSKKRKNIRRNYIHPVFKKRSVTMDKDLPLIEKFDLKHHRRTRHTLYRQIEKFLGTQGNNGLECVLKTLCETGQRRNEDEPGNMVTELLRAIFTLPEPIDSAGDLLHQHYDQAHAMTRDCQKMFSECPHSIWNSTFNT